MGLGGVKVPETGKGAKSMIPCVLGSIRAKLAAVIASCATSIACALKEGGKLGVLWAMFNNKRADDNNAIMLDIHNN